jgi:hypothetical protein
VLLSVCGLLGPIALLLVISISMLLLLLMGILVSLELLLRGRVWRVAAVRVVALVILALGKGAVAVLLALLVLLVRVVGRCLVALFESQLASSYAPGRDRYSPAPEEGMGYATGCVTRHTDRGQAVHSPALVVAGSSGCSHNPVALAARHHGRSLAAAGRGHSNRVRTY